MQSLRNRFSLADKMPVSSVRYCKVHPAPYDGPVGAHYNKECPVELFRATAGPGKNNRSPVRYSKVCPAPYDGPVGAHYNRECPVELFRATCTTVPGQTMQTYVRSQDVGKGEGNTRALSREVKTDLKVNNFVSEVTESKNEVTNDTKKVGIIRRLGKSVRGLRKRLARKGKDLNKV